MLLDVAIMAGAPHTKARAPSHHRLSPQGAAPRRAATRSCDLFELLERVQSSRLDDQRCVLPPYFSQVVFVCFFYFILLLVYKYFELRDS